MPEEERPEKVMFVIVTDGLENYSNPKYTRKRLMKKIKRQTEVYNWLFLYLGANQDAIAVAESYGIAADKAVDFAARKVSTSGRILSAKARELNISPARYMQIIGFNDEDRAELGED